MWGGGEAWKGLNCPIFFDLQKFLSFLNTESDIDENTFQLEPTFCTNFIVNVMYPFKFKLLENQNKKINVTVLSNELRCSHIYEQ